ncbi:MAG: mechanosensitive ion channel domain-containing protein [Bacteroidota bacterium]
MRYLLALLMLLPMSSQAQAPAADDSTAGIVDLMAEVEARESARLEARLQRVFATIEAFQNVDVQLEYGVAQLAGTVLSAEHATEAAELAQQFDGVLYVENAITTEVAVETRVAPALERIQGYVDQTVSLLPLIVIAILIILVFWTLSRMLGRWDGPSRQLGMPPLIWNLLRRVLRALVLLIGLALAFDLLGITALVGAVLGTAGVAGIAIGFAFQDIIENYLAGALMSIRQPFHMNDVVEVDGRAGRVIRLTSRELVLLTAEGNHVRLPNALVFGSVIVNYSRNPRRRFNFEVGIDTEADLVQAMRIGLDTLRALKGTLDDPAPTAQVETLGDSSVVVGFYGWVHQQEADYFKVRSEAKRLVKTALDEAGIVMPEPIYQIRVRNLDGAAPAKPPQHPTKALEEATHIDVTVVDEIERQVQDDLALSDEENLLR